MNGNRYNTKVRRAMSEEWVKTSKLRFEVGRELEKINSQLNDRDVKTYMSYSEYVKLEEKAKELQDRAYRLTIENEVWDKARDICMDIADEECEKGE